MHGKTLLYHILCSILYEYGAYECIHYIKVYDELRMYMYIYIIVELRTPAMPAGFGGGTASERGKNQRRRCCRPRRRRHRRRHQRRRCCCFYRCCSCWPILRLCWPMPMRTKCWNLQHFAL